MATTSTSPRPVFEHGTETKELYAELHRAVETCAKQHADWPDFVMALLLHEVAIGRVDLVAYNERYAAVRRSYSSTGQSFDMGDTLDLLLLYVECCYDMVTQEEVENQEHLQMERPGTEEQEDLNLGEFRKCRTKVVQLIYFLLRYFCQYRKFVERHGVSIMSAFVYQHIYAFGKREDGAIDLWHIHKMIEGWKKMPKTEYDLPLKMQTSLKEFNDDFAALCAAEKLNRMRV
ncbi:ORF19 [Ranid herpesvirus 2]|uniref:ORF19 n=1 Tax=Ranid herpesvirus 2 TaxID=389214 RepID=Q14W87_9VIRU|nr:ORF19 [Ranid herpesvirus 2]ABG25671.1 ORF19 [Ranid herpesvirus 2]